MTNYSAAILTEILKGGSVVHMLITKYVIDRNHKR